MQLNYIPDLLYYCNMYAHDQYTVCINLSLTFSLSYEGSENPDTFFNPRHRMELVCTIESTRVRYIFVKSLYVYMILLLGILNSIIF